MESLVFHHKILQIIVSPKLLTILLILLIVYCLGDETYSLVSDSWSTDVVVASDNEGLADPQQQQQQGPPPIPPRLEQPPLPNFPAHVIQQQLIPPNPHPVLHESLSAGRISDLANSNNNAGLSTGFSVSPAFSLSFVERERLADNILDRYRTIPPTITSNSLLNGLRNSESVAGSSKNEVCI